MSRNFELMQDTEMQSAVVSTSLKASAFALPGKRETLRRVTSDLTQGLVERIFLQKTQEPPHVVVFAGIDHGNGCSQIAAWVAEALAGSTTGAVCLVDANLRSTTRPKMFGAADNHGLTDSLRDEGSIMRFAKQTANGSFWLLSSGTRQSDSAGLLNSEQMRARTAELRREFDFVIVDMPPLTRYPDAIVLGKSSDGMVVVLEAESTRREAARSAVDNVRASKIPILAAVLNKRTFPIPERLYNRL